jgi:hypothetical protein
MSCDEGDSERTSLLGLVAVNLNNEGENPTYTEDSIKKEAFVIGLIYMTDGNKPSDTPIYFDNVPYESYINPKYEKIVCLTDFNDEYPAGFDVTNLFIRYENTKNKISGIDALFVLTAVPSPGIHSFRISRTLDDGSEVRTETKPIKLY